MSIRLAAITVDCDDAVAVARFWSAALDRPLAADPARDTPLARAWHRLQAAATVADTPAVGQEFQDLFIGVGGGEGSVEG